MLSLLYILDRLIIIVYVYVKIKNEGGDKMFSRNEIKLLVGAVVNVIGKYEGDKTVDRRVYKLIGDVLNGWGYDWIYEERRDLQGLYDSVIELIIDRGFDIRNGKIVEK